MTPADLINRDVILMLLQREQVLFDFLASGAFANELTQVCQPSTGKWWIK